MTGKVDDLVRETNEFMSRHWSCGENCPVWSEPWSFHGELPNHDKQGCYALVQESRILYVGLGIGKGTERYQNNGIGYRTKRYWKLNSDNDSSKRYGPKEEWLEVDSIWTIGFEPEYAYLAAALEIFLIQQLNPPNNRLHRRF